MHSAPFSTGSHNSLSMEKRDQQRKGKFGAAMLLYKRTPFHQDKPQMDLARQKLTLSQFLQIIRTHAMLWENLLEFRNKKENILKILGITENKSMWSGGIRLWPSNSVGDLSTWLATGSGQHSRCCLLLHACGHSRTPGTRRLAERHWWLHPGTADLLTSAVNFCGHGRLESICLQTGRV